MLLLRCSLLADSMSRSTSFCPSTIATRSSSAWVALNSMRFIGSFPAPISARPGGESGRRPRPSGAGRLTSGGRGREAPLRQQKLPGYEGADAGTGHLGLAAINGTKAVSERPVSGAWVGVFRVIAQTVSRMRRGALAPRWPEPSRGASRFGRIQNSLRLGRSCAPRVMPLHPGDWPVRRLRSSINIATFPGRKARTVSRINRIAPSGQRADAESHRSRPPQAASRTLEVACRATAPARQMSLPIVVAGDNYKEMNDLSKDAANHLAVDEAGAGQRVDNFLLRLLKGVPKSHIYRILRSGEVRVNRKRVRPDVRLALGDDLRIPPVRIAVGTKALAHPPRAKPLPILYEDEALIAI